MMFELLSPGGGASLQDGGRAGWRSCGVPPGGAMDGTSARLANRLVGNPEEWPVIEFFQSGARVRACGAARLALTGTDRREGSPGWRSFAVDPGAEVEVGAVVRGVWTYLAVAGGFCAPRWFGSAGASPGAGLGRFLRAGDRLTAGAACAHPGVAGRFVRSGDRWMARAEERVPVWPGPEWGLSARNGQALLGEPWSISNQINRAGVRLEGGRLSLPAVSLPSAPVRMGTIQVPPSGQPIVVLRDGPTVGGYPRLALIDPMALDRFVQVAPGETVRFCLAPGADLAEGRR